MADETPLVPMAGLEIGDMLAEDIVEHHERLPLRGFINLSPSGL